MDNIPTELLRTLIAVVDLRSFTKAAHSLGVTQPAVSAQIKRLQILLGSDLFDKSAPGVALTEKGELVANYARRMLAINDQILHLAVPRPSRPLLRIGIPGIYGSAILPSILATFHARSPHLRLQVRGDPSENLLRDLRQGHLDLCIALTSSGPALDARHYWTEEVVWVGGAATRIAPTGPVALVGLSESGLLHRTATSTLSHVGRDYEMVFLAFSTSSLSAAVAAGLGVTVLPRREVPPELVILDTPMLPKCPDVCCGIYLRDGVDRDVLEQLADFVAEALQPRPEVLADHRAASVTKLAKGS